MICILKVKIEKKISEFQLFHFSFVYSLFVFSFQFRHKSFLFKLKSQNM